MSIILVQQIVKTYNFLRIFEQTSYLTTMLVQVFIDLKVFMFFYIILIFMFAMINAVIGNDNYRIPGSLKDYYEEQIKDVARKEMYPGEEYG